MITLELEVSAVDPLAAIEHEHSTAVFKRLTSPDPPPIFFLSLRAPFRAAMRAIRQSTTLVSEAIFFRG